jgi:hypothetical protein
MYFSYMSSLDLNWFTHLKIILPFELNYSQLGLSHSMAILIHKSEASYIEHVCYSGTTLQNMGKEGKEKRKTEHQDDHKT